MEPLQELLVKPQLVPTLTTSTMKQLIWCAIAAQKKIIQVDTSECRFVYDLQKAVAYKTRYKVLIPRIEIWKVGSQTFGCIRF